MLKIGIGGIGGRMGQRILALVDQAEDLKLGSAIETESYPGMGKDIAEILSTKSQGIVLAREYDGQSDAVIEFSAPDATIQRVQQCRKFKTPMVIGTTGLTDSKTNSFFEDKSD